MKRKIYYHDTDAGGIVYYANYLKYFEEARVEFFASLGLDIKKLQDEGLLFVVKELEIEYKHPAFLLEEIKVIAKLKELHNSSFVIFYEIKEIPSGRLITQGETVMVCVDKNLKVQRIPKGISTRLRKVL